MENLSFLLVPDNQRNAEFRGLGRFITGYVGKCARGELAHFVKRGELDPVIFDTLLFPVEYGEIIGGQSTSQRKNTDRFQRVKYNNWRSVNGFPANAFS